MEITERQYNNLKAKAARVETEREEEYKYEILLDAEGRELGFASYHAYKMTTYTKHQKPKELGGGLD